MPFQNLLNSVMGMCVYFFLVFFLPTESVFSQHTLIGSNPLDHTFQNALTLFEEQQYEAAQKTFSSYLVSINASVSPLNESNKKLEATYYLRLCELNLKKSYSETNSIEFISEYEQTLYADNLKLELANSFYEQGNYRKAAYYFAPLEKSRPTEKEELKINFRLAYSYFKIGRTKEALRTFLSLQSKNNEYYAEASYYVGFINYELGSFKEAIKYLNQAKADKKYTESSNKLIATSYYNLQDCNQLSNFLSSIANEKHDVELFYYAANCAYLNKDYDLAYEWFGRYKRNTKQFSDSVAHQYLHTLYVTKKYDEFLDYQNTSIKKGDFYSSILLMKATIYENKNDYKKAASTYDELALFNPSDAEKAYFSKLKNRYLSQEYDLLIKESKKFESKFPQSIYLSEVILLTSNEIAISQDAKTAMAYLKARDSKGTNQAQIKKMYIDLALQSTKEFFNQSSYVEMNQVMNQLKNDFQLNDSLQNFVNFYTAESFLQTAKVSEAETYYKKIPSSSRFYADAKYGMGVINFNKASYNSVAKQNALILLEEYLSTSTGIIREKAVDALTRIATIYASNKHYKEAEVNFMKALNLGDSETEYINFCLGQIYFVTNDYTKAMYQFDKVMQTPNSLYAQYSQIMKAKIYENQSNRKQVIALLSDFIKTYPQSDKLAEALYIRGNAWNGLGENRNAINDYTALITNYPNTDKAKMALSTLENYPEFGVEVENIQELRNIYASHNSNYNPNTSTTISNPIASNSSSTTSIQKEFDKAFKLYENKEFSAAIAILRGIVSSNEIASTQDYDRVYYYLGKNYQFYGDNSQALKNLQRVGGQMQADALSDMGDIEFGREGYNAAITYYKSFAKAAPNDALRIKAWEKLTQTYCMQEDYKTANNYLALIRNKKTQANRDFVRLYENKILAGQNQIDTAIDGFSKLGNDRQANAKYASEALFELATLMHKIGDNSSAKSILKDLKKQFAEQKETQQKANKLALLLD